MVKKFLPVGTALILCAAATARAQQTTALADLSIQDLLKIEVTSVSRKAQEVNKTAAAVYVITQDDIRRSGATTLPDVLRLAPGVSVAELSANTWSVTARGFGGVHANKLLVLIDGRSVYTPLNGGVNWDMQLLPLESIQQIEVIRGPGGSLWGANAINGVVNIITKAADRTKGVTLETHSGRYDPAKVNLAYGGKIGESAQYVARGQFLQRGAPSVNGVLSGSDDVQAFYGRTRLDWDSGTDKFSFQADAEHADGDLIGSTVTLSAPFRVIGQRSRSFAAGDAMLTWKRLSSSRVDSSVQLYYTGEQRSDLNAQFHTIGIDSRQHRAVGARQDLVFGAEFRLTDQHMEGLPTLRITPSDDTLRLATVFAHDELVITDALHIAAGAKVERNYYTGFEIQPSVRGLWAFSSQQSVWAAVSRAIRTPNQFEHGMHVLVSASPGPAGMPFVVALQGSPETVSERGSEYEVGYRAQRGTYSIDLTGFVGSLDRVATLEPGIPAVAQEMGTRVLRLPLVAGSSGRADSRGFEASGTWKPYGWWGVSSNYTLLDIDYRSADATDTVSTVPVNGPVPTHIVHARSFMDLPHRTEASVLLSRASSMPTIGIGPSPRLDLQFAWGVSNDVRLTGGVRNVLHNTTAEYADRTAQAVSTPVRVSPYAEFHWLF